MRIVSWNMNQQGHAASHEQAWRFLRTLEPDIALVQEAIVPDDLSEGYDARSVEAWEGKRWGSAILSRVGGLELAWQHSSHGAVVIARTELPSLGPISVASLQARVIDNRVIPGLRLTFEAIRRQVGERFIVGGDLNTARVAARAWPANGHGEFWNALDASRFKDCYYTLHGEERQSYWREWLRGKPPTVGNSLMDDHVFVDPETMTCVTRCVIWDTREVRELSDHGPVVVDLRLPEESAGGPI